MADSSSNNSSKLGFFVIIAVAIIGLAGAVGGGERAAVRESIRATSTAEAIRLLTQVPQFDIPESTATTELILSASESQVSTELIESPMLETTTLAASPTVAPTSTVVTSTPPPESRVISIDGFEENGVRLNFEEPGLYDIAYLDGAYSPWPNDSHPDNRGWSVSFMIFVNDNVRWGTTEFGLPGPVDEDYYVGPGGYYPSQEEAMVIGQGSRQQIRVSEGDFATIAVVDEQDRYGDNRGMLTIQVTWIRP